MSKATRGIEPLIRVWQFCAVGSALGNCLQTAASPILKRFCFQAKPTPPLIPKPIRINRHSRSNPHRGAGRVFVARDILRAVAETDWQVDDTFSQKSIIDPFGMILKYRRQAL
jgi:hypothetical protein